MIWSAEGLLLQAARAEPLRRIGLYLGTEPSTPSTYQLIAAISSADSAAPAGTCIAPLLSLMGPAKGSKLPATIACFLASNTRATSDGIAALSGVSTTTPSLIPRRFLRPPVQEPSSALLTSSI